MTGTKKSPDELRAERLAREAKERDAALQKFEAQRVKWSGWLQVSGWILLLLATWFLVLDPGGSGSSFVNLQKLYLGQTAGIVGSVFLVAGAMLKFLS